jgi:hypothetical protein
MSSRSTNKRFLPKAFLANVNKAAKLTEIVKFWRQTLIASAPFIIACLVLLSTISLHSPVLLFCLLTGSLIATVIQRIGQQVHLPKHQLILLQVLAAVALLCVFWLDYFAAPAQAQFFKKAEDFFQNTLTQGASNDNNTQLAVGLVFNVLRALYLLYIAVALIGVVNAVRKDEDWQSIARTPLLVVVAVTIADVLTGFIIGDSSQ